MTKTQKVVAALGIGHGAPPARAWTLLLIAAVIVSVYGNTAHALLTGHGVAAAAWFATAPVALFWVTHLVAKTAGGSPSGVVKWLIWFGGIPAALGVAAMAFVVSFRALQEWTLHQGGDTISSFLLPLIVDLTIALSSVMVLALRPKSDATEAVHSVMEPAHQPGTQVLTTAPAAVPTDTTATAGATAAAQRAGAPTRTVDAHVQQQGGAQPITAPKAAQESVVDTAQEVATSDNTGGVAEQSTESAGMSTEVGSSESGRFLALVHATGAQHAEGAQDVDAQQVRSAQRDGVQVAQGTEFDPAQEATRLIERGSSRLDEETLTDVISRIARGESHNSIAGTTGVSRNTVMRLAGMVPTEPGDEEASA